MSNQISPQGTIRHDLEVGLYEHASLVQNQLSRVIGNIPVASMAGTYPVLPIGQAFPERGNFARKSGGGFHRTQQGVTEKDFRASQFGLEEEIDLVIAQDQGRVFDFEQIAARRVHDSIMQDVDRRAVEVLTSNTDIPTDTAGTWWEDDTSTPLDDVDEIKTEVRHKIGHDANTLIVSREIFKALRKNKQLIDRGKNILAQFGTARATNIEIIQAALDIETIIVMDSVQRTAADAKKSKFEADGITPRSDIALEDLFPDDKVLFVYMGVPMNGTFFTEAQFAGNFVFTPTRNFGFATGGRSPGTEEMSGVAAYATRGLMMPIMESYPQPEVAASIVRARVSHDIRVITPEAGYWLTKN